MACACLLVHHVLVREDSAARVEPEHFLYEELVRLQQGAVRRGDGVLRGCRGVLKGCGGLGGVVLRDHERWLGGRRAFSWRASSPAIRAQMRARAPSPAAAASLPTLP
eukprot:scaffold65597_cov27-Phaeocystis_antarctica.AAC.1